MPLGNLTSQFFANVYLNELDYFVKHELKAKYYIRYVDDFVLLHHSHSQLQEWNGKIDAFLRKKLKIDLHTEKSKILSLGRPIPFVGLRIFYYYKLLKKFNRKNAQRRVVKLHEKYKERITKYDKIYEIMQGTFAYMRYANTYRLRIKIMRNMEKRFLHDVSSVEVDSYLKSLKMQQLMMKYNGQ